MIIIRELLHIWLQFKATFLHFTRALTRFMRSRNSVMSLSRDWMIRFMSLIRGPKFASSLSNFDFSYNDKQILTNTL